MQTRSHSIARKDETAPSTAQRSSRSNLARPHPYNLRSNPTRLSKGLPLATRPSTEQQKSSSRKTKMGIQSSKLRKSGSSKKSVKTSKASKKKTVKMGGAESTVTAVTSVATAVAGVLDTAVTAISADTAAEELPEVLNETTQATITTASQVESVPTSGPQMIETVRVLYKSGTTFHEVSVQAHVTVKELKKNIKNQLPTLKHQTLIRLVHNRKELHDHEPLTLHALPHLARIAPLPDPTPFLSFLPKSLLDPAWDRHWDESHPLELTGTDCTRGGRSYARPVGWMRFGLKVKGKYEDDDWLGTPGPRNHSHPNEWFVTFHGTAFRNAASIAKNGYNTPQVWSTTDINVTLGYSQKGFFQVNGKQYRVVMQNRVRPGATAHFGYHYDCNQTQFPVLPRDIRPYAILICPMAPSQQYPY